MILSLLKSTVILTAIFDACITTERLELPDYDYSILRSIKKNDLRRKFLKKRIHLNREKLSKNLNEALGNIVYLDDVAHFEVKPNDREGRKVAKMEKEFRKFLAMKGMTYVYKRDSHWRTWREVEYSSGKRVVCYRCSNIMNSTCKSCNSGGYWIIEESPPPCPFELFSMIDRNKLCASNYTQLSDVINTCPSVINFFDLSLSCDNPIITNYRITKKWNSDRVSSDICKEEFCEITTFYRTYEDYILFRIANSTNDVVFSKIMKSDKKKYACLSNCGRLEQTTRAVTKNDVPVKFNLLPFQKSKRESTKVEKSKKIRRKQKKKDFFKVTTTVLPCKKIKPTTEDYEEKSDDEDFIK